MAAILQESIPTVGAYNGGPTVTTWVGQAWQAQASYVLTLVKYKGFRHQLSGSDGTIRICLYACDYKGMPVGAELDHADMLLNNFPNYPSSAVVTFTFTGGALISKNCRYIWYAILGGLGYGAMKLMSGGGSQAAQVTNINQHIAGSVITNQDVTDMAQQGLQLKVSKQGTTGVK